MSCRPVPGDRRLHLIDLENLVGGSPRDASAEVIVATAHRFRQLVGVRPDDQLIVGHNPSATWLFASTSAFPGAGVRVRGHEHGGESAILELVEATWIATRFSAVVIGSGDRAFAPLACSLSAAGVHVTVAGRRNAVSRNLARWAEVIVAIDGVAAPAAA